MAQNKGNTAQVVEALVTPVLEQLGLRLWDVRFEKEGPDWFLRVFIDRDEPLDINTCEEATRAINPVIDAADPIAQGYYMEVGSPGLGRHLTRDAHFAAKQGEQVQAHLYRVTPQGEKDIEGVLLEKADSIVTLQTPAGPRAIEVKDAVYFKLCDDADLF